jgi:hypothetical protein
MRELERQITMQIDFDPAVTQDEVVELRDKVHDFISDWCCIPTPEGVEPNPEDPETFHRVTGHSSQIAYKDPG